MLKVGARDRIGKVTGSLMYYVAGKATEAETNAAFARCIGTEPFEETYAMRLGSYVEPFLISEYERAAGCIVERRQEEVPLSSCPDDAFVTIDGMIGADVIAEFKFLSPYTTKNEIFYRYYDQVALQCMCTGARGGLIIAGQGTNELIEIECLRDESYEKELLERIWAWLLCVKTLTPPYATPMPLPPPERWRKIDLSIDQPNWGAEMTDILREYSETLTAAITHDELGMQARALVPDDVGQVLADGWRISRNKRGILSITARKAA